MLWSRPMPLGWYFAEQWRRFLGNNWVEQQCDKFIIQDRFLKNFANELPVVSSSYSEPSPFYVHQGFLQRPAH